MEFRTTFVTVGDSGDSGGSDSSTGDDGDTARDGDADPDRTGGGGWIVNGLEDPVFGGFDPLYALNTAAGMAEDIAFLEDEQWVDTSRYLVECALPAGASITKTDGGQTYTWYGEIGLAPEWETGACDLDCQQWVSACLLARTNDLGQNVPLWFKGEHSALGYDVPDSKLVFEAAYFGNLFASTPEMYLCEGSTANQVRAQRQGRTCLGDDAMCGFTIYNNCTGYDRCPLAGPNDNVAANCRDGAAAVGSPHHTIAVYVEK